MEDSKILETLKKARNRKRGFDQAVDLVVCLKDIDLTKPEH